MLVTKNTYGVTSVFRPKNFDLTKIGKAVGSSLDRERETDEQFIKRLLKRPLVPEEKKERKPRSMSKRTKSKVRRKVIAFSRLHKHLTFVTLTFVNKVPEEESVKILGKFLENASKRFKNFQYLWVAEKQLQNKTFVNNIHFHIVTNKYWKRDRWRKYWIELQAKHGIVPRQPDLKVTHSFDVKGIDSADIKRIGCYMTKYLTKNDCEFHCQIWNCSKKISWLATTKYDDQSFLKKIDALERADLLGGRRSIYVNRYHATHIIPLNKITLKLYDSIDEVNRKIWHSDFKESYP